MTDATRANDQVAIAERAATIARDDLAAARGAVPPRPSHGNFGVLLWVGMICAFASIEGIATRALWAEVTDDKRLGLVFAGIFAIVFTTSIHILATWLWSLVEEVGQLRLATLAIVVAMFACACGLLWVTGLERDQILISNLEQQRAQVENSRVGTAAGASLITRSLSGKSNGAAGTSSSSGLLGGLPSSGPDSTPTRAPATATTNSSPAGVSATHVSFRFVIWLNFLVMLAMVLFARGRTMGEGYRQARRRVERLEARDAQVRLELARAEAMRQNTNAEVDYCERVLFPIALRCASEEQQLDRLFIDQIERSAAAAGHGQVNVRLRSEPADALTVLSELLETETITLTAAGIKLLMLAWRTGTSSMDWPAHRTIFPTPHLSRHLAAWAVATSAANEDHTPDEDDATTRWRRHRPIARAHRAESGVRAPATKR